MAYNRRNKLAETLATELNKIDFDAGSVYIKITNLPGAIHMNLFDLFMRFLYDWSRRYRDSRVRPEDNMYKMCEMSYHMMEAITYREPTGRHAK